ncbi:MAG: hypothetical protein N3A38_10880 [Planctomycetota bacterium]|nr:hypothetical protein [Planctomycetota bacterium]
MKNQSADENRYVRIERVRNVTIYRRGRAYCLYFREGKRSVRRRVGDNIAEARAMASRVAAALAEKRPSPIGFRRITFGEFADGFIVYARDVRRLAPRTVERYRAAMRLLKEFAGEAGIGHPEALQAPAVEDFVRWLRSRGRSRNGRAAGKIESYKTGGIRFVLGVARTAYNWAARRRHLPPYSENPFGSFPIEELRDRGEGSPATRPMSGSELEAFFRACDDWQRPVFLVLAVYGMRVGELMHLLLEDVDLDAGTVSIRSKPELFWYVKTGRGEGVPGVRGGASAPDTAGWRVLEPIQKLPRLAGGNADRITCGPEVLGLSLKAAHPGRRFQGEALRMEKRAVEGKDIARQN